ncbi:MAG: MxaD protein [Gammaproteobacteria bacterium]|jgi:hypothetical protein|nr:MAG: MxaD protein [Gammaproteobacteria bacterium]PHR84664.1 MAG: MxaD protein [Colwellia sp.]
MKVIKNLRYNIKHKIKICSSLILALTLLGCNSMPSATEKLSVERTLVIHAAANEVWAFTGGWTGIDNLAPTVITSILSNGNEIGSFRKVNLKGGGIVEETMVDKSETSYSYIITKSPLPLSNYTSTISVKDLGNGSSEFSWKSNFRADGVSDAEAIKVIAGLYEGSLEVLKKRYSYTNKK